MGTPEISVSGGAGGLEAEFDDLATLGRSQRPLDKQLYVGGRGQRRQQVLPDLPVGGYRGQVAGMALLQRGEPHPLSLQCYGSNLNHRRIPFVLAVSR